MIKRAFDIFFSLASLLVFAPLLLAVSFISAVVLGRPVLFVQKRIGKNEKEFNIYKFRTMLLDERIQEEKRITKWGSFLRSSSIDELPELFNILKGDMSFVGPRPLLPEYLSHYTKAQRRRHDVVPGLTGLAQVRGRNTISWNKKFAYDLEYISKKSFLFDIKIILETFRCVFMRSGVNSSSSLSMQRLDNPFFIIGCGGHGKSVLASAQSMGHEVRGFLDDSYNETQYKEILGVEIVGSSLDKLGRGVIAIGNSQLRKKISIESKLQWETLVHPSAVVHPSASIGEGSTVLADVHIGPDVKIGKHSIINTKANIEHDSVIGDYCHIAPGATLCGGVIIGDETFVGANSTIIPNKKINKKIIIGAGSTVVADLEKEDVYVGSPAKETRVRELSITPKKELVEEEINISMARPCIDQSDIDSVVEVLKSGHLSLGPKIVEFEDNFKDYIGTKHAVAVSSGTAALHMIMLAMDIGKGDEVLVPSFTFVSSVSTILHVGATPVYVDIDPLTYCIDPADMESKITENTKAIMGVDIFGHPADWESIVKVAKKHKLYTIDDSCEALGAKINGKMVGSFADASAFAFYPNKQITTGEGGLIVTDNDLLAEKFRMLRNHGRSSMGGWLKHDHLGYNFRMNEMSAALGVTQLKKVDTILNGRESIALKYNKHLRDSQDLRTQVIKSNIKMSWFVYVVTLSDGLDRDTIIERLQDAKIPARAYFDPIHTQPFMDKVDYKKVELPVTDNIATRTIALPFHAMMTDVEVEYIATSLKKIISIYKKELVSSTNNREKIA